MRKNELMQELGEYDVLIHPNWTVPELRQLVIEQREARGVGKVLEDPMRGITKLSVKELQERAKGQGILIPEKPTRGLLIKLLQDASSTPDETIMGFGKYKGWMFHEVPMGYRQWAREEVKGGNSHPELVQFATVGHGGRTEEVGRGSLSQEEGKPRRRLGGDGQDETPVSAERDGFRERLGRIMGSCVKAVLQTSSEVQAHDRGRTRGRRHGARRPGEREQIEELESRLAAMKQKYGIAPKAKQRLAERATGTNAE